MNILHMKYVAEVAKCGSINKAAEKLLIGQPNLSRVVKEVEASLNIKIFERSAKGMTLTPEGEMLMEYASNIIKQVDAVEAMFKNGVSVKKRFSVSVPRASYIAEAFARFSVLMENETDMELYYKETNSLRAIENILQRDYRLGIIRYAERYDKYYKSMLDEKKLDYEMITDFKHVIIMSRSCPLAKKESITIDDLTGYTEIAHSDPYVPSLPQSEVIKEELPDNIRKRIFVFERGSQFEILTINPKTFLRASPVPSSLLDYYGLVQRTCKGIDRIYKDVLIHRNDYTLSKTDNKFIEQLIATKRKIDGLT